MNDTAVPQAGTRGENRLRARLKAGDFVLGLTISTGNLEAAVLAAREGFHFLWVEMEHSPVSLQQLRAIVLGTASLETAVIARVPVVELWTAKRVLDQGVRGVIFPFVTNGEQAKIAAQACCYPPGGLRGSGAGLAATTWFQSGNYYDSADTEVLTVAVIERKSALGHLDEIAATPGLDVMFIGVSDLSFSLGFRGRQDEPELQKAIDAIVAAARRHHKFLGRPAITAEDVQRYHKQGFQFLQTTTELGLMRLGAKQILGPLNIQGNPAGQGALY